MTRAHAMPPLVVASCAPWLFGLSLLAIPAPAAAYLIDLNDAAVVDHGSMALELQPIGYFQTLVGDEEHQLIAPSFQLYWGLAEDWDVLYIARGFAILDDMPDQSAYSWGEQMIGFRAVLRHGAYSSDEADGPSLVFQGGLFLPGVEQDAGFGASAALLFAQQWDFGTLHLNVWTNLTRERAFELFVSSVLEGPPDWSVRPQVEVYFDLYDDEPYVSGLVGAIGDVTDSFSLQAGVRVGGWEDYLELEVRVSSWIEWEVWDPGAEDAARERQTERRTAPRASAHGRQAPRH